MSKETVGNSWDILNAFWATNITRITQTGSSLAKETNIGNKNDFD